MLILFWWLDALSDFFLCFLHWWMNEWLVRWKNVSRLFTICNVFQFLLIMMMKYNSRCKINQNIKVAKWIEITLLIIWILIKNTAIKAEENSAEVMLTVIINLEIDSRKKNQPNMKFHVPIVFCLCFLQVIFS